MAKFLIFIGDSRDPGALSLFQSANVDTVEIHWVHSEEVKQI